MRAVYEETGDFTVLRDEELEVPKWMRPGYLSEAEVKLAQGRKEVCKGSKGRRLRTRTVEKTDFAQYAIENLYTKLTQVLICSRR